MEYERKRKRVGGKLTYRDKRKREKMGRRDLA